MGKSHICITGEFSGRHTPVARIPINEKWDMRTVGQSLLQGANEALAIAKGKLMPADVRLVKSERTASKTEADILPPETSRLEEE